MKSLLVMAVVAITTCCGAQLPPPPVFTTTYAAETANNTSSCSGSGLAPGCTSTFLPLGTQSANVGAQTATIDPVPGHVSPLSVHLLAYAGFTGKFIAYYQPWFCNTGSATVTVATGTLPACNGHIKVGYNENSSTTITSQMSTMIAEGFDVVSIDWYGTNPSQAFNLTTSNLISSDLSGRSGFPLHLMIMEDKGALEPWCPTGATDETSCLTTQLESDMDYINTHYANQSYYEVDSSNHPIVQTFIDESAWSGSNWATIWSAVKTHTNAYAHPFKLIREWNGSNFTEANYDGNYGWQNPPSWSSTNQFFWGWSAGTTPTYLDNLYSQGGANPSLMTMGVLTKGFDDNNATWGTNRVRAQQCGQVLMLTSGELTHGGFFGPSNQLKYIGVSTWNDYEEGTEFETGIDNCYTLSASIVGNVISWTLHPSDATYASTTTIHNFRVWYSDPSGNMGTVQDNISSAASSLNVASLVPAGTWTLFVEMVGQPMILNKMSNGVSLTVNQAPAPSSSWFVKLSSKDLRRDNEKTVSTSAYYRAGWVRDITRPRTYAESNQ